MNYLHIFTAFYSSLYSYKGIINRLLSPVRRVIRSIANLVLPSYLSCRVSYKNCTKVQLPDVIVSFTSFPARIERVWMVVECMRRQTVMPKKVILWLSKEQFPGLNLPDSLKNRIDDFFEVRFVEGDIRSHKKYYYVSKEYPDSYIILIDDDILYSDRLVARLWDSHIRFPEAVICSYAYRISYEQDGTIKPYSSWSPLFKSKLSKGLFFGSGGGTLYKPSSLHEDLTNIDLAIKLTPIADDIWLNTMVKLNDRKVFYAGSGLLLTMSNDSQTLTSENIGAGRNDEQLKCVSNYYLSKIGKNPYENNK